MQKPSFGVFDPFIYALQTLLRKFYVTVPFLIVYTILTIAILFMLALLFDFLCNFTTIGSSCATFILLSISFFIALFFMSSIRLIYIYVSLKWYDSGVCTWRQVCSHFNQIASPLFFTTLYIPLIFIVSYILSLRYMPYLSITILLPTTIIAINIILSLYILRHIYSIFIIHHTIDKQYNTKTARTESKKLINSYASSIITSYAIIDIILLSLYIVVIIGITILSKDYVACSCHDADPTIATEILQMFVTGLYLAIQFIVQALATTYMYRSLVPVLPENTESIHAEVPL